MTLVYVLLFASGMLSGLLAGLMGVGGGLITVPVMVLLAGMLQLPSESLMHIALASSLSVMVVTTSASAFHHWKNLSLPWSHWLLLLLPLVIGAGLGSLLANELHTRLLMSLFAGICLLIAVQMWLAPTWQNQRVQVEVHRESPLIMLLIGVWAALSGTGGGTLTVPYFNRRGLQLSRAISVSAVCGVPIAISGALSYALLGMGQQLGSQYWGYVHLPAVGVIAVGSVLMVKTGARLAYSLPVNRLKKIFALILLLISLRLFYQI